MVGRRKKKKKENVHSTEASRACHTRAATNSYGALSSLNYSTSIQELQHPIMKNEWCKRSPIDNAMGLSRGYLRKYIYKIYWHTRSR